MLNMNSDQIYDVLSDNGEDGIVERMLEVYFGTPYDMKRTMSILRLYDLEVEMGPDTPKKIKPKGIGMYEIAETLLDIGYALGYLAAKTEK